MFSLFKKNRDNVKEFDLVWINTQAKLNALTKLAQQTPQTIFIAWFDETIEILAENFSRQGLSTDNIYLAQRLMQKQIENYPVVFVEHYPLRQKEEEVYQKLALKNVTVHTALDEPFMKTFGSDRIIDLMKKLGMKEDEPVQHQMVSASIKNAQEKLNNKISFERSARSQAEWLRQNIN